MLEDRDYMRQAAFYRPYRSFTVALLVVNAIVFLLECVTCGYPPVFFTNNYFALSVEGLKHGFVWQLLTYQFMHANLWHILLNGWAIYVFGREIEETVGRYKFLVLFLASGVIGGLLQSAAAWRWPEFFGGAVVGASAGTFGLVAVFAMLFPDRELALIFPPMILRAKTLLIFLAILVLFGIAFPFDNTANIAHLGGMLTGIVFVRQSIQGRWLPWKFPVRRTAPRKLVVTRTRKGRFWCSMSEKPGEDLSADEFLQTEVDPILDKISAHGIQSLTAREREILEKARSKMEKR